MIYKPFEVVLVPFPFTEKQQDKKRPAIVLSSKEHQTSTQHVTLLMITTAKNNSWTNDYSIKCLTETGLKTPSIVRQKLFTIDSRLVIRKIGALSSTDAYEVTEKLKKHLSIKNPA